MIDPMKTAYPAPASLFRLLALSCCLWGTLATRMAVAQSGTDHGPVGGPVFMPSAVDPATPIPAVAPPGPLHRDVRVTEAGTGVHRFFVFEPAGPVPKHAPVVLFHHGWGGMNPLNFGAWIDHLVRRGNIVVYPVYQTDANDPPQGVTRATLQADLAALALLRSPGHVRPDLDRVVAAGFSMGATVSANLAADAASSGLPPIRAMLLAAPGNAHHVARGPLAQSIIEDLAGTPPGTLVVIATGDEDRLVGTNTGLEIYRRLCHLPATDRDILIFHADQNEGRTLHTGHGAPGAPDARYDFGDDGTRTPKWISDRGPTPPRSSSLNELDWHGYWKLLDGLMASAFLGRDRDAALGGGPRQLSLGAWPDGRPIRPIERLPDPCETAPTSP